MSEFNYNRIKEVLARKRKSNIQLAKFMQVNKRTVSTWCTNMHQPVLDDLYKIADFLGVEATELLTPKSELIPIEEETTEEEDPTEPLISEPEIKQKPDVSKPRKKKSNSD